MENNIVSDINNKYRTTMKSRIGSQGNYNGAIAWLRAQGRTGHTGGALAYAMFTEAVDYADKSANCDFSWMPDSTVNNSVIRRVNEICSQANNTHGTGGKALAGAAIGLNFGLIGAVVGAIGGWAFGQNQSNNDYNAIATYANQAADYFCDVLCNAAKLYINGKAIGDSSNKKKKASKKVDEKKDSNNVYPKFSDVIGLEEAKQAIKDRVIDPSKHPDIYKKYGYKAGGGILLYGLPGTGKTMFAQAVANEIDGEFFSIKASDIKSKWYGETEGKIKELFDSARKEKTAVIFIDEFEAIGVDRNKNSNDDITASSVVPELLAQMQGFEEQDDDNILLIIAATNRPWDIDSSLTRPGRFDYKVYVELPNLECRKAMIKNYLKKVQILDAAVSELASKTEGYNGADIKNVCDALVKIVIHKEIDGVTNYHLDVKDIEEVTNKIKSSVSAQDVYLMNLYREHN